MLSKLKSSKRGYKQKVGGQVDCNNLYVEDKIIWDKMVPKDELNEIACKIFTTNNTNDIDEEKLKDMVLEWYDDEQFKKSIIKYVLYVLGWYILYIIVFLFFKFLYRDNDDDDDKEIFKGSWVDFKIYSVIWTIIGFFLIVLQL
uniref:Uncharacterized protein n=1 Tax=viral metagenome TaxID=1070528 RepID=A0A6C0CZY6_9ZZZZ